MELVIGLLVIGVVGYFVFFRKKEDESVYAPYKVETPVPAQDVAPQPVVVVEGVPSTVVVEGAGRVELPQVEKTVVSEKKPRKPRAVKTEKTAAKKAAPKKAAATKTTKKSKQA